MSIPDEFKQPIAEEVPVSGAPATPAEPVVPAEPQAPLEGKPLPVDDAEDKTRYQKRIDQLTAARRAAEERAQLAEQRAMQYEAQQTAKDNLREYQRPGQETVKVGDMTKDEWLEWNDEDPLAAAQYVAEVQAERKAQQIMGNIQATNMHKSTVESVYAQHPELKDVMEGRKSPSEVPFWQVYDEVAREMPEAAQLRNGPVFVMREAERRVKERQTSDNERTIAQNAAQQENDRQQRVGAGHTLGAGARPPSGTAVKLSAEEEKIARKFGMSPEQYAANKSRDRKVGPR